MTQVYLSLGSNCQRRQMLRAAVKTLRQHFGAIECSSVYQSAPVNGCGEDYYNLAIGFETEQSVTELHHLLRDIEQQLGRDRTQEDRVTMDLDILLFGTHQRTEKPPLPHPDILRYPHVLVPLAQIAGKRHHPINKQPLSDLQQHLFPNSILHPVEIALD